MCSTKAISTESAIHSKGDQAIINQISLLALGSDLDFKSSKELGLWRQQQKSKPS
jgi:hypothetical protein